MSFLMLNDTLCLVILSVIVIIIIRKVLQKVAAKSRTDRLFARLKVFQDNRLKEIQNTSNLKSSLPAEFKKQLILSDAVTLIEWLNEGKVTSYELLLTFYERAITIGLKIGALAEINIEAALEQAKKCDEHRAELRKTGSNKLKEELFLL